jgi:hypothetical protein
MRACRRVAGVQPLVSRPDGTCPGRVCAGTARQVVLDEDAYSGERTLLHHLQVEAGELWIADRNFCVRSFLFRLHRARSVFLVRWHGKSCPFDESEPLHAAHGTTQGAPEQMVWLQDPESQEWLQVRRIVLPLAASTRNGDTGHLRDISEPGPPVQQGAHLCRSFDRMIWRGA